MNAAVRVAALVASAKGVEVLGVRHGYQGLVEGTLRPLPPAEVADIIRDGGTMLGSARCLAFHERSTRDRARQVLAEHGVEGLIVVGGNGSLTGLEALTHPDENSTGLKGIGIPASIDNDVATTRLAIGVDTAVNTIVEACDKISDTAGAHDRTFIVEVMGRDCGYLAMASGIAAGANAVLFPEMDKSEDEIVDTVARAVLSAQRRERRTKQVLVIMAEGVKLGIQDLRDRLRTRLEGQLAPGRSAETRVTVLGHVVRGGRPSALDRQIASRLGRVAVSALLSGESRKMVAWGPQRVPEDKLTLVPRDPRCALVDLPYVLEETRAMLDGESEATAWRRKSFEEIESVLAL